MIHLTDMTGLASSTIAMVAALFQGSGVARLPKHYLALLTGMVMVAALTPFGGLPLAAYVRGIIGDLSITSLVLLMLGILTPLLDRCQLDTQSGFVLQILIVLAAVVLYPMALGMGLFDPYRLGYGNPWFMGVLLATALTACFRRIHMVAICIVLAVFAWSVGWYESNNLWDYLLDPLVAIYAIGALTKHSLQASQKKQKLKQAA